MKDGVKLASGGWVYQDSKKSSCAGQRKMIDFRTVKSLEGILGYDLARWADAWL